MSTFLRFISRWGLGLLFWSVTLSGVQAASQSFTLRPGWNAIFLEITPEVNRWQDLLGNLPVASIWRWNANGPRVEFIQDPATLIPNQATWSAYFAASRPEGFLSDLFTAQGGTAYLLKLEGTQSAVLTVTGRPALPQIQWKAESFNFVGFHLEPGQEPFFRPFFEASTAQANTEIYRLNTSGAWELVSNPATTRMKSGEAYWVYSRTASSYTGPLKVTPDQIDRLDYGQDLAEQQIQVQHASLNTVTLKLSGAVPLSYWSEALNAPYGWQAFPNALAFSTNSAEGRKLRLGVMRQQLPNGQRSESTLTITDGLGMRVEVGVYAAPRDRTGLWVGQAFLQKVSQASSSTPQVPTSTPAEFQFPLIVHVNAQGQANLLQEVAQAWKEGTLKTDSATGKQVVDQPGREVLLTNNRSTAGYSGVALRNGQPTIARMGSAAFNFVGPQNLSGAFGSNLATTLTIEAQDPANPFLHRYHPDHDNLDERRENFSEEAFRVARQIQFQFTAQDPSLATTAVSATWGDSELGGIYREELTGLHRQKLVVEGTFRLRRVSTVGVLNDGQ